MGSLNFLEFAKRPSSLLPPLSLSASPPPALSGAARCRGRPQDTSCFAYRPTRHPSDLLDPLPLALDLSSPCHATPTSSAAATSPSPSPWTTRCRASAPQLAHTSVPRAIPFHFPLLASPAPCPEPPEH